GDRTAADPAAGAHRVGAGAHPVPSIQRRHLHGHGHGRALRPGHRAAGADRLGGDAAGRRCGQVPAQRRITAAGAEDTTDAASLVWETASVVVAWRAVGYLPSEPESGFLGPAGSSVLRRNICSNSLRSLREIGSWPVAGFTIRPLSRAASEAGF